MAVAAATAAWAGASGDAFGFEHAASNTIAVAGRKRMQWLNGFMTQSMPVISRRDLTDSYTARMDDPLNWYSALILFVASSCRRSDPSRVFVNEGGCMVDSTKRAGLTRREALILSSTAGVGIATANFAAASDSIKTAAHQGPGNLTTPRSAIAKTQNGKVRGYLDGGVFTFKGIPGPDHSGRDRWLPLKLADPVDGRVSRAGTAPTARRTCIRGPAPNRRSSRIGMTVR